MSSEAGQLQRLERECADLRNKLARTGNLHARRIQAGGQPTELIDKAGPYLQGLSQFLQQINHGAPREFFLIFSGTIQIQPKRGNRPIRMALTLAEMGVPVLFSYYRTKTTDPLPEPVHPLIFQSPIDLTLSHLPQLITGLPNFRKTFVYSIPHVEAAKYLDTLKWAGWAVIYEARDHWEEFNKAGMAKWYNKNVEKFLALRADLVCAVSHPLAQAITGLSGREVRLSPNALDTAFVPAGYHRQPDPNQVRVGYFGSLTPAWFDWNLVVDAAVRHPEWSFELLGHGFNGHRALPPNVTLLGLCPPSLVCALAERWHAAIIPFKMGLLSDCVDPIKIYEYLALGLPVVSMRMPQIDDYPATRTVNTARAFITALEQAVSTKPPKDQIDAFLENNTWADRAREMLAWADEIHAGARARIYSEEPPA